MINKDNIKDILIEKVNTFNQVKPTHKMYDDVREFLLENYDYRNLSETIWNIVNDFPDNKCKECGGISYFHTFNVGYKPFCCVKCSNVFKGKDKELSEKIARGVSKFNQSAPKEFWLARTETHQETIRNESDERRERKKREKSEYMKRVHAERCPAEKLRIENRIRSSLENSGHWVPEDQQTDYYKYKSMVYYFTNKNDIESLPHFEKRGMAFIEGAYHLDHKFSIYKGFKKGILPSIIGSLGNLEFIPAIENLSKGRSCSISKEELLSSFNGLKIGDF